MSFEQLLYTSCRRGITGHPGFQTLAVSPGVSQDERQEIERLTAYQPAPELPRSPTDEEVERLFPICFGYRRLKSGRDCIFRSRYLGKDYSNRFGNFLTHALIWSGGGPMPFHPVEFYESPLFLRDCSELVARIEAGAAPVLDPIEASGDMVNSPGSVRSRVDKQLGDEAAKRKAIAIVRAVLDSAKSGRPVVLMEEPEVAIRWLEAAQLAFPPAWEHLFSFATYTGNLGAQFCTAVAVPKRCLPEGFIPKEREHSFHVFDDQPTWDDDAGSDGYLGRIFADFHRAGSQDFWKLARYFNPPASTGDFDRSLEATALLVDIAGISPASRLQVLLDHFEKSSTGEGKEAFEGYITRHLDELRDTLSPEQVLCVSITLARLDSAKQISDPKGTALAVAFCRLMISRFLHERCERTQSFVASVLASAGSGREFASRLASSGLIRDLSAEVADKRVGDTQIRDTILTLADIWKASASGGSGEVGEDLKLLLGQAVHRVSHHRELAADLLVRLKDLPRILSIVLHKLAESAADTGEAAAITSRAFGQDAVKILVGCAAGQGASGSGRGFQKLLVHLLSAEFAGKSPKQLPGAYREYLTMVRGTPGRDELEPLFFSCYIRSSKDDRAIAQACFERLRERIRAGGTCLGNADPLVHVLEILEEHFDPRLPPQGLDLKFLGKLRDMRKSSRLAPVPDQLLLLEATLRSSRRGSASAIDLIGQAPSLRPHLEVLRPERYRLFAEVFAEKLLRSRSPIDKPVEVLATLAPGEGQPFVIVDNLVRVAIARTGIRSRSFDPVIHLIHLSLSDLSKTVCVCLKAALFARLPSLGAPKLEKLAALLSHSAAEGSSSNRAAVDMALQAISQTSLASRLCGKLISGLSKALGPQSRSRPTGRTTSKI